MVVAQQQKTESFPPISPSAHMIRQASSGDVTGTRRRRKSSNLGEDPRGDTSAGALATRGEEMINMSSSGPSSAPSKSDKNPRSKRRKTKSLLRRARRLAVKHTWVVPLSLILAILSAYYISPGEHNPLHSALFLSYANPPLHERTSTLPAHIGNPTQYGKGRKDFAFVAFYTIVLTFTREFFMQRLIRPIAIYAGVKSRAKQSRFMEQFYTAMYFAVFGPFGMWIMSRTPVWYFNIEGMYEGFPHRAHEGYFKAYYLLQASYWAQQAIVMLLQQEKKRKDYLELVFHHIVTLALIGLSYRFHFAYMGIAVYITMDISDFFLATSKVLNYIDSIFTASYFTVFLFVWAYLRHWVNLTILYSLLPGGKFSTVGPFDLNWETQQYKCWISQIITFTLLLALQAVNVFWFALVLRILWRIVTSGEKKDDRSDDEEEVEEEGASGEGMKGIGAGDQKPSLQVNGEPMSPVMEATSPTTGADTNGGLRTEDVVRRKK